jgi:hypothetical protein
MSGVLIKGMKMPRNCFVCPLSVVVGERLVCEVTRDEVLRWKIDFNCPLIELPPHGRLIDADKLKPKMLNEHYKYRLVYDAEEVNAAPTIIEADTPVMFYPQVQGITPTVILEEEGDE